LGNQVMLVQPYGAVEGFLELHKDSPLTALDIVMLRLCVFNNTTKRAMTAELTLADAVALVYVLKDTIQEYVDKIELFGEKHASERIEFERLLSHEIEKEGVPNDGQFDKIRRLVENLLCKLPTGWNKVSTKAIIYPYPNLNCTPEAEPAGNN
jgi:hypothetical protein